MNQGVLHYRGLSAEFLKIPLLVNLMQVLGASTCKHQQVYCSHFHLSVMIPYQVVRYCIEMVLDDFSMNCSKINCMMELSSSCLFAIFLS